MSAHEQQPGPARRGRQSTDHPEAPFHDEHGDREVAPIRPFNRPHPIDVISAIVIAGSLVLRRRDPRPDRLAHRDDGPRRQARPGLRDHHGRHPDRGPHRDLHHQDRQQQYVWLWSPLFIHHLLMQAAVVRFLTISMPSRRDWITCAATWMPGGHM